MVKVRETELSVTLVASVVKRVTSKATKESIGTVWEAMALRPDQATSADLCFAGSCDAAS
jgi:hypothetical protein